MIRPQAQILQDMNDFLPGPDGNWLPLESLIAELWKTNFSAACLGVLLGVFERFPDEDGAGVFWSIVHGIESSGLDYEQALRQSLERQPSGLGEAMLHRLGKSRSMEQRLR